MSKVTRGILVFFFCASSIYILFTGYRPLPTPAGKELSLDAYPIKFERNGVVIRGPWQGKYQLTGENLICFGAWQRQSPGGNTYSTPRGLYEFTIAGEEINLTKSSSNNLCPVWAATIPPPPTRAGS